MANDSEKKKTDNRPISPHLSIYKLQITSTLSILHRVSGGGVFVGLSIAAWWFILWVFSGFEQSYLQIFDYSATRLLVMFVSLGLFYHLCNGIRHLIWDSGCGFSTKFVNYSGWIAVLVSILLTLIFYWSIYYG